jgi:hypothetical protein
MRPYRHGEVGPVGDDVDLAARVENLLQAGLFLGQCFPVPERRVVDEVPVGLVGHPGLLGHRPRRVLCRDPVGVQSGLPDPLAGGRVGPAALAGDVGTACGVVRAIECEDTVGPLVQRQFVVGVVLEVVLVCPQIRAGDLVAIVDGEQVRAALAQLFGDGDGQVVGALFDPDDDVVAGLDTGAPVYERPCVFADTVVHAHGEGGHR